MTQRKITILGSTGSVGRQTIDLIDENPDKYKVCALTAHSNFDLLAEQAKKLNPELLVIADKEKYKNLKESLPNFSGEILAGPDALITAAQMDADWVMAAIVGAAGLPAVLAAARRGKTIAFANKECLVCAGDLMMSAIAESGATLLPVDSEHNAIFQVFDQAQKDSIERIILTASGGPFRTWDKAQMAAATPKQAVAHPNWSMGAKISVDSASMMNKALEVIEAHYLFDLPSEQIDVVIHPQSIIHSMVAYRDGSVLAQLGAPDMRIPIAHTLAWPDRMQTNCQRLDLTQIAKLEFEAPDEIKFPSLRLARDVLKTGGAAGTVMNAANEVCVASFLKKEIRFLEICEITEKALDRYGSEKLANLDDLGHLDKVTRDYTTKLMTHKKSA